MSIDMRTDVRMQKAIRKHLREHPHLQKNPDASVDEVVAEMLSTLSLEEIERLAVNRLNQIYYIIREDMVTRQASLQKTEGEPRA